MLSRRGTSEVIAVLLLIMITVAASTLLYVYSAGVFGRLQGKSTNQPYTEQIALEYYNWSKLNSLNLIVRNVGTATVTVADVFVNGVRQGGPSLVSGTSCTNGIVQAQLSCTVTVSSFASGTFGTGSASPTTGVAYPIKVVSIDGGVFSYTCVAGQIS